MGKYAWSSAVTGWARMDPASRPGRLVCVIDSSYGLRSVQSAAERLGIDAFAVTDDSWVLAHGRPSVIIGNHDQIFSRALNRGYGVRRDMQNVQFGLLNCDCMWADGTGSWLHAALSGLRRRLPTFRASSIAPGRMPDGARGIPVRRLFAGGDVSDISEFMIRPPAHSAGHGPGPMRAPRAGWVSLPEHSSAVERLVCDVCPGQVPDIGQLRKAARYHDWGKAHPAFQEWLLQGVRPAEYAERRKTVWAKRRPRADLGRLEYRHDAAGACAFLQGRPEDHLAAYLIMTHHGRFRSGMPDAAGSVPGADLGGGIITGYVSFAVTSSRWEVILDGVYRRYGPFLLSYYEAILRVADMLASDS